MSAPDLPSFRSWDRIRGALLQKVSNADFSNAAFPFGTAQEIEIGYGKGYALRVTYVGELGWELYIPTEFAGPIFDLLIREGKAFELKLAGYHALDSLRSEKGYRHFGHDVTPADTPLEAGLSFAVSFKKNADFIGRQSLEKQKAEGLNRRLIFLRLEDPEPTLLHDEPIWRNGNIIGRTSSGAFGYTVGSPGCHGLRKACERGLETVAHERRRMKSKSPARISRPFAVQPRSTILKTRGLRHSGGLMSISDEQSVVGCALWFYSKSLS